MLCRASAELSRTSPSRELWGSEAGVTCSVAVSLWEACPSGKRVPVGSVAGRAAQASASSWPRASAASCRSGVVSEEGGRLLCVAGARGLFSAAPLCRGGTEVTAWSHPAVPPRPHPGHAHTKPLGLSAAKDPFLKVKIFVPLCTSCPTETRLFPFLPTSTCNHPNTQPEELCGGAVGRSQCAAQHPRWKGEGQKSLGGSQAPAAAGTGSTHS